MPVTIALRFPWGRIHATPWERSANEAEPEWPPSPWRLLRALYSVWRFRCPAIGEEAVARLLIALAEAPAYRLPPHAVAHTRHYFPDPGHRCGESGGTDKVFDAFVVVPDDEPVQMHWAGVDLEPDVGTALATLLRELPFLGRAESLCDASIVVLDDTDTDDGEWIGPLGSGEPLDGRRAVSVLIAAAPLDLPRLLATTKEVRAAGFLDPPGSRRVRYALPAQEEALPRTRRRPVEKPTLAVLGVHSNVLPNVTASLAMCELLRMAVQGKFGGLTGGASSPTLSGKREEGQRRLDQHRHAHYLAVPREAGGRFINRFVIWAPEGFDQDEIRAINALRKLNPGGRARADGGKDLRPVDIRLESMGGTSLLVEGLTGPSTLWQSVTPFITTRHPSNATRRRLGNSLDPWPGFLEEEIRRELQLRQSMPIEVTPYKLAEGPHWLSFRRHRAFKSEKLVSAPRGGGFEIRFAEPVTGPIALGAQSHLGLGLFVPVDPVP